MGGGGEGGSLKAEGGKEMVTANGREWTLIKAEAYYEERGEEEKRAHGRVWPVRTSAGRKCHGGGGRGARAKGEEGLLC